MAPAAGRRSHPPENEDGPVTMGSSEEGDEETPISMAPGVEREVEDPMARDRVKGNLPNNEDEGLGEVVDADIAMDCVIRDLKGGKEVDGKEGKEDGAIALARPATAPEGSEDDDQVPVAGDLLIPDTDEEGGETLLVGQSPTAVKEEGRVAKHPTAENEEEIEEEEMAPKFFQCPICMGLVYEPAVLACGHMFCVGCIYKYSIMEIVQSPICPSCKSPYNHLPRMCELIGGLVRKLQPLEVETWEKQEGSNDKKELGEVESRKIQLKDVTCPSCRDMLYEPLVLNCGHVFCKPCAISADGTPVECKTCGAMRPSAPTAICWGFKNFIQLYFPSEYKSRTEKIQSISGFRSTAMVGSLLPSPYALPLFPQCMHKGTSSLVELETPGQDAKPSQTPGQNAKLSQTHVGVGCDSCGVYPIHGSRYSCKSCVNFDLCEKCSKIDSSVHGRSGQLHSPDHVIEKDDSYLFPRVLTVLDERRKIAEDDGEEQLEWQLDAGVNAGFRW